MAPTDENDRAFAARVREAVLPVLEEERRAWWDRIGFEVRSPEGIDRLRSTMHALKEAGFDVSASAGVEKLRVVLALPDTLGLKLTPGADLDRTRRAVTWVYRSEERSATMVKRMLAWLFAAFGAVATATEIAARAPEVIKWFKS